ncbi:MAG: hypothetical protein H6993_00750 [Pseudomonadales bacterium]|nr:hypothetical protein [Pseudomonadales bacterium]MCP5182453.1 hypothetical protein [Pseudomonadales bacterium]
MVSLLPLWTFLGGLASAVALLFLLLRHAVRLRLVSVPNSRSSHHRPTPTGGGLAFAVPVLGWCALSALPFGRTLAIGAGVLALLGLVDDARDLRAIFKFLVQLAVVAWFVPTAWPELALWWQFAGGLCLLWFVNLFNFMDGIDGFAACQVLLYALGTLLLTGAMLDWTESLLWLLIGTNLGFLLFNWSPARIFMGDAGALMLGLMLPAVAVELAFTGRLPLVSSLLLFTVFVVDSTYTLLVRMITGQPFLGAHRTHLYQILSRRVGHARTCLMFMSYGLGVLLPLAWAVQAQMLSPWLAIAAAVVPLMLVSFALGAGMQETPVVRTDGPDMDVRL